MKLTKSQLKQIIKEELGKILSERGFGEGDPAKDELSKKREVYLEDEEEELDEAYSEKQTKWACAQMGKSRKKFKGKPSLSSKEATEMCKDTELKKAKKKRK